MYGPHEPPAEGPSSGTIPHHRKTSSRASAAPGTSLFRSVSSIRSNSWPPCRRANAALKSAVRNPPRCINPVGDGANRTRTMMIYAAAPRWRPRLPLLQSACQFSTNKGTFYHCGSVFRLPADAAYTDCSAKLSTQPNNLQQLHKSIKSNLHRHLTNLRYKIPGRPAHANL